MPDLRLQWVCLYHCFLSHPFFREAGETFCAFIPSMTLGGGRGPAMLQGHAGSSTKGLGLEPMGASALHAQPPRTSFPSRPTFQGCCEDCAGQSLGSSTEGLRVVVSCSLHCGTPRGRQPQRSPARQSPSPPRLPPLTPLTSYQQVLETGWARGRRGRGGPNAERLACPLAEEPSAAPAGARGSGA